LGMTGGGGNPRFPFPAHSHSTRRGPWAWAHEKHEISGYQPITHGGPSSNLSSRVHLAVVLAPSSSVPTPDSGSFKKKKKTPDSGGPRIACGGGGRGPRNSAPFWISDPAWPRGTPPCPPPTRVRSMALTLRKFELHSCSFHRLARMRGACKIRDENFADFSGANLLRTEQQPFGMLIKKCCLASTTSSFEFRHYLSFASNGG